MSAPARCHFSSGPTGAVASTMPSTAGPIGPNLTVGVTIVSDTIAYAFFDDGGGSPIDADFDDVILRITASFRGGETTPTPLPGALPLLASGLGAFGYFGWRRKRKIARPESRNKSPPSQILQRAP